LLKEYNKYWLKEKNGREIDQDHYEIE